MSDRAGTGGIILTVVGGLVLAGATTAPWVEQVVTRAIGDAEVTETVTTRGVELAPVSLPVGLAVAAAGVLLAALGGRARRVLAAGVALGGAASVFDGVLGLLAAIEAEGAVTPAPGFALAGAVAVLAGSWLAIRVPRSSTLPGRFDLDADLDDEWSAAVDPAEEDVEADEPTAPEPEEPRSGTGPAGGKGAGASHPSEGQSSEGRPAVPEPEERDPSRRPRGHEP